MPVVVSVACDICGDKKATQYPSFFELMGGYPSYESLGVSGVFREVPPPLAVSTRGCLRDRLTICLCREHFTSIEAALAGWLSGQQEEKK